MAVVFIPFFVFSVEQNFNFNINEKIIELVFFVCSFCSIRSSILMRLRLISSQRVKEIKNKIKALLI